MGVDLMAGRGPIRKTIPNFPGYEAGFHGDIYNAKTGRKLKPSFVNGRVQIVLRDWQGVQRCRSVGSLVLTTWLGPAPEGRETSHLDGDPWNNGVWNLEWETHAENMARKRDHGTVLRGDRHGKTKLTDAQVLEIVTRLANGERGIYLATEYGVSPQTISGYKYGSRVVTRTH